MKIFHPVQTISTDKIMLPKHQALAKSWDMSKQQSWGELTNLAILITSEMIKNNQFESILDLYTHMAGMRTLIGAILGHDPDVGKLGRSLAQTPITNHPDSGYKDMHAEFKSWIEALRSTTTPNVDVGKDGFVELRGSITSPSKPPINYVRSRIAGQDGFTLFHCQDMNVLLYLANELFKRLQDKSLNKKEKQDCIEGIYYYSADAMPCARGAASIAQMLFYALEDAYLGQMRYLGKMASKFGHAQGVLPDIAAMLSPTLEDFQKYLNDYVIDPDIAVTKHIPKTEQDVLNKSQLLEEIEKAKSALEQFNATLKYTSFSNAQRETIGPMLETFKFLSEFSKKISDQPNQLAYLQMLLTSIKQSFSKNPVCYPQFYALLEDKQGWPKSELKAYNHAPDPADRNQYLESITNASQFVHDYNSHVGNLFGWNNDTHHVATHYSAKKIMGVAYEFSRGGQKSTDINQYFATCESVIRKQKSGFGNGIDELIEILSIIERDKQQSVAQKDTIDNILKSICARSANTPYDAYINILRRNLDDIYLKADTFKTDLRSFAPLFDALNLKHEKAEELIMGKQGPKLKPA